MSTDDTLAIARSYESRFDGRLKIISEKDDGLYDAMNRGIGHAAGDVVGILNSDDFYDADDVLEKINEAFVENDIDCVYGNLVYVERGNTDNVVRRWQGSPYKEGAFARGWHPAHPTFYVKRECLSLYGAFDISFAVSADFELMLRLLEKYHLRSKYMPVCMVRMREGGVSNGSLSNIIKGNKNIMRAFRKNGIEVSLFYPVLRLVPKIISRLHIYE